jgi:UDP-N-acetylglucosamine acyltransferase
MGNRIWPGAVIAHGAIIGHGNEVFPNAFIGPRVHIGDANVIHSFAVVGSGSQARLKDGCGRVEVGDSNEFHPFSVVSESSFGLQATIIRSNAIVMQGAHIAHDCDVGNRVVISNFAALAGHVTLEADSIIGAFALIAQHRRVGRLAHVLPQVVCRRDVAPFECFHGKSPWPTKINSRGLRRAGGYAADLRAIKTFFAGNDIKAVDLAKLTPFVRETIMSATFPPRNINRSRF